MKTTVYRYYDENEQLLYVGITGDNYKRQSAHRRGSSWFKDAVNATFEHFDTREEALEAETIAIRTENPMYNIAQTENYATGSKLRLDFSAKVHLVQMLSEPDEGHNELHQPWAHEVKSWILRHECFNFDWDTHFVYHLYDWEQQYKDGHPKFAVHEQCAKCIEIFTSDWYKGTKQYVIDSVIEYMESAK